MVTEEMIEHMGGPAGIADALKAFEELDARFDVERPRFAEQYPDQWVAMTAGGADVSQMPPSSSGGQQGPLAAWSQAA